MKKILPLYLCMLSCMTGFSQLNMTFVGQTEYNQNTNDIWGYAAPDGTEYALVGTSTGFSIVTLTDPTNPEEIFFIPGNTTTWRDIKTWGETAYVVCDNCSNGLLVVDLSDLPNSAPHYFLNDLPIGTLNTAHNIYIDELGYAYLAGGNLNEGGMIYMDCFSTPGTPIYAGSGPAIYSHDIYTRNNIMYSSEIYKGKFTIYDVADKNNTIELGSQETEFEFTHNAWLSDDANILFTTDEQANASVGAYDVSDPDDIVELDQFRPVATVGDGVIPHNLHVLNDFLIISYYSDGCILVDAAHPDNLIECGNFDTFIPATTGFSGAWGAYPYLPSGLILVTDRTSGLFVLEPDYIRACYLEGNVTDASNGNNLIGVTINISDINVAENSDIFGVYRTGHAISGTYEVTATKPGFEPAQATVDLTNGEITIQDFQLIPSLSYAMTGNVVDATSGAIIPDAKVRIYNENFDFGVDTDENGNFTFGQLFDGSYTLQVGKWGSLTTVLDHEINMSNSSVVIELEPGYEDNFSLDLGWKVEGDASSGMFERGQPIGIFAGPPFNIWVTPPQDVTEDDGNDCFVTGNIDDEIEGSVSTGLTRITSPPIDMTSWGQPMVSFYTWYFSIGSVEWPPNLEVGSDSLVFKVYNGIDTATLDTFTMDLAFIVEDWSYSEHNIADAITLTDNMQFIFEIETEKDSFVIEAAVDFFKAWDANPLALSTIDDALDLKVYPNPSAANFVLEYDLVDYPQGYMVVYNLYGQEMKRIKLEAAGSSFQFGEALPAGVYFAKIQAGYKTSKALKLIKQ